MLFGACQEELFEQYGPEVSEGEQVELTFYRPSEKKELKVILPVEK